MESFGWLVRHGVLNRSLEVGDQVDSYRLLEPLAVESSRPHGEHDAEFLNYVSSVSSDLVDDSKWRLERTIYCPACPTGRGRSGRSLVSLWIHIPTARRWVAPLPERTLGGVAPRPAEAWPLHGQPGDAPCPEIDVTSCRGCRTHWVMLSTHDDVLLRRVEIGRHEAELVE